MEVQGENKSEGERGGNNELNLGGRRAEKIMKHLIL